MLTEKAVEARRKAKRDADRRKESLLKRVHWFPGQTARQLHVRTTGYTIGVESTSSLLDELVDAGLIAYRNGTWWPAVTQADQDRDADDESPTDAGTDEVDLVVRLRRALQAAPEGLTRSQMRDELEAAPYSIRRALKHLQDTGEAVKIGTSGGAGRPATLWGARPPAATAEPTTHDRRLEALLEVESTREKLVELCPEDAGWLAPMLEAVEGVLRRIAGPEREAS